MSWNEWLVILGIPSIISGLFLMLAQFLWQRAQIKRDKIEDAKHKELEKKIEEEATQRQVDTTVRKGLQAILRDRLQQLYHEFKKQGYAEFADKQNFDNMYKNYHSLGQNGVMDEVYREVMELPSSEKERP